MEDNNNPTPRYIPENYSIGINVGGMHFKTRNFFEGIALAAALGGLAYWIFNKMSFIEYGTRIGLIISFAIMGLVLGIIGINDEPISVFFLNWIRFLKDKRTAFYNPHTKTRDKNKVRPYLFTYKEEKESLSTENITSFFKKFKASIEKSQIEKMVDSIETQLQSSLDREVTSMMIGELTMDQLKNVDEVAYVRFASVYRQFKDINTFMEELNKLLKEK